MAGRPAVFNNPEEFDLAVEDFLEKCGRAEEPVTITGLCLFLGFESRQSLYDYEKREGYSYSVKRARLIVESGYERKLHEPNATGPIFALKNFGWTDRQEIDQKTEISGNLQFGGIEIIKPDAPQVPPQS